MTRILLYTTQPMLTVGLEALLSREEGLTLAATCNTVADLMEKASQPAADLYFVEAAPPISISVLGTLTATVGRSPVVLWSEEAPMDFLSQAISVGVRGILRKSLPVDSVTKCLREVAGGGLWVEKNLSDRLLFDRPIPLTARERQLVTLLAQGLKNKEIAWSLGITEGTVKVYLSRLFRKVGANDRFDLALFALKSLFSNPGGDVEHKEAAPLPGQFPVPRMTGLTRVHRDIH